MTKPLIKDQNLLKTWVKPGGVPPSDPGGSDDDGSDDEDDSDDDEEGDDEEDTEREEEEETMSEVSEESEISDGIYDLKGRRVNMEEIIKEWQNRERDKKPVKIIRGPRGHRGPRGRQGPKGHRGKVGPAGSFRLWNIRNGNNPRYIRVGKFIQTIGRFYEKCLAGPENSKYFHERSYTINS